MVGLKKEGSRFTALCTVEAIVEDVPAKETRGEGVVRKELRGKHSGSIMSRVVSRKRK